MIISLISWLFDRIDLNQFVIDITPNIKDEYSEADVVWSTGELKLYLNRFDDEKGKIIKMYIEFFDM